MPFITTRSGLQISQDVVESYRDEAGKLVKGNGLKPLMLTRYFSFKKGSDGRSSKSFADNVYYGSKHSDYESFEGSIAYFYIRTDLFKSKEDWSRMLRFFIECRELPRDIPPIHYVCDINYDFRNIKQPERNIPDWAWDMMNDKKMVNNESSVIDYALRELHPIEKDRAITPEDIKLINEILKPKVGGAKK